MMKQKSTNSTGSENITEVAQIQYSERFGQEYAICPFCSKMIVPGFSETQCDHYYDTRGDASGEVGLHMVFQSKPKHPGGRPRGSGAPPERKRQKHNLSLLPATVAWLKRQAAGPCQWRQEAVKLIEQAQAKGGAA